MGGVVCEYIGETSRSTYERSIEHQRALRNKDQKSPLYKHMEECHPGKEPNLLMTILRLHRKALSRQIHEALLISKSKAEILLNNKSKWSKSRIPRIRMTNKGRNNDEAVQEIIEEEEEEKVRKIYEETLEEEKGKEEGSLGEGEEEERRGSKRRGKKWGVLAGEAKKMKQEEEERDENHLVEGGEERSMKSDVMGRGERVGDTPLLHPDSQVECNEGEPPRTNRKLNKNEKVILINKGGTTNKPPIGWEWGSTDVRLRKGENAAKSNGEGGGR